MMRTAQRHDGRNPAMSNYQEAFHRIRAEYLEMPGLRLTAQQLHRLSGVDVVTCVTVLDDLVRAKFLQAAADGIYLRAGGEGPARWVAGAVRMPGEGRR